MVTVDELQGLLFSGGDVVDPAGRKIGSVGQLFLDASTGEPAWVTVSTGLFGTGESFVPLAGAAVRDDVLHVAHDKGQVKDAPRIHGAEGALSPEEERDLYRHYGLLDADDAAGGDRVPDDADRAAAPGAATTDDDPAGPRSGQDRPSPVPPPTADPAPPLPEGPGSLSVEPGSELDTDPEPEPGTDPEPEPGTDPEQGTGSAGAAAAGPRNPDATAADGTPRTHGRHVDDTRSAGTGHGPADGPRLRRYPAAGQEPPPSR